MLAASRSEPDEEAEEVGFIDGVEHLDRGPLDDFIFQRSHFRAAVAARPVLAMYTLTLPAWARYAPRLSLCGWVGVGRFLLGLPLGCSAVHVSPSTPAAASRFRLRYRPRGAFPGRRCGARA